MPELVLELNGQTWTLDPSRTYTLGRDPQGDVAIDDARVSWRHATVRWGGRAWVIDDHGSTNGTYVQGRRLQQLELAAGMSVHLGNATDGPRLTFSDGATGGAPAQPADVYYQAHAVAPEAQQAAQMAPPQQAQHAAPPYQPGPGGGGPDWGQQPPQQYQQPQPGWQQPPQQPQPQPEQPPYQQPPYQQPVPQQQAAQMAPPQAAQAQQTQQPQQAQPYAAQPPQQGMPPQGGPGAPGPGQPAGGDRSPTTFYQVALGRVMRIGRSLENDLVVSDLQVSRNHAEFRASPDGRCEIRDLGSHNGTYVNGQPLPKSGSAVITPQDTVGVGHSTFRLVGDRLEEFVDTGEVSFSARHLTVKVDGGKVILNNVTFGVPEKSLVGVIGPSGSGKSTLLRALTGYRPADEGAVLYDNRNLYTQFAELRQRIGLVPQDDILHKELKVRTALRYAAKLRFPGDVAEAERNARVEEVLAELKLDIHATKKITSLSGGQRKRVSVALELLTKPSLIFLDEPTSGLDPGMDRDVMQLLRGMADDGRTVLVVTHSVAELQLCDKLLVMAPGGGVAYFGPPEEALNFFGYDSWADVFSAFENYREYDWMGRWQGSQHYQMYAADIDAQLPQGADAYGMQSGMQQMQQMQQMQPSRQRKPQSWGSQLWTLIRRYVSVIASDRSFLVLSFVTPLLLGFVSTLMPSDFGLTAPPGKTNHDAGPILLILAIGACFSGAANSVRELIKERVIYERERATGLSRSAYLMSKVIVLGIVAALQGVLMCMVGFFPRDLPDEGLLASNPAIEMTLVMIALGGTSMMFGLIISALVKTSEKTMILLVLFAVVQVVFTGVLFKLYDSPGVEQLAWLMPSRWAMAALAATVNLGVLSPQDLKDPTDVDPLWEHELSKWMMDMSVLVLMGVLCGFAVIRLLRRHEPEIMRK
ncbi:FHA domain-containing protein [Streptomyces boncukensis]|uniref:ABC transporter ATP-binding protein/permease n=1 Tax=Streptomyces boncukensis TaxID=2711219 RepID=UPI0030B9F807